MARKKILNEIIKAVATVDPQAEVYLFGSRARGDYRKDSDWDIFILTPNDINEKDKDKYYDILNDVEIENDMAIGCVVRSKANWEKFQAIPLYQNIRNEGVRL